MILGETRDRYLGELNLSENIKKLTQTQSLHPILDDCCRRLAYSCEPEDFSPQDIDVIPLWEGHSTITVFHIKEGIPEFIKYYVEDIDSYRVLGSSIQEVLLDLVENEVCEEIEEAEFERIKCILGI